MPVDTELQPILDLIEASGSAPPMEIGPEGFREMFATMCVALGTGPRDIGVADLQLDGRDGPIPARIYRPPSLSEPGAAPALVYMHGGGFVIGFLDTHDAMCRLLAEGAGVVVVSVDYRLAPEHPAPAAVRDVDDALADVMRRAGELGIDVERLAVGGDSAGANLATVAAIHHERSRSQRPQLPPLRFQMLLYPVVDLTGDEGRFPSLRENAEGYFLTAESMAFFEHHYLDGSDLDATSPDVSPIRATDLAGLAPAFVLTAELDPLRDEGEAYAERLRGAGVEVRLSRYDGAIHGFVQMAAFAGIGRRALDECSEELRGALEPARG